MLVVEDDLGIATQIVRGLRRGGYDADHVTTGGEALRWGEPDVVLLDLGLPDTDGVEVCRQLRERSRVAIIVVTARGEEPERVLALDAGADDYLVKPFGLAELLAGAQDEIARLSRLVDGLLEVARAESAVTVPVPVQVAGVVRDRVAAWSPLAEERGVGLSASAPGQIHASLGEGHLEQILDNLIANALDAVPAGGHVRVSARPSERGARVVVADDGPGMSRAQQEAAFRRFASNTSGGTGLGLAIVHRLVTSNGGSAELSDTPGGGLTLTLDLPAAPADPAVLAAEGAGRAGDNSLPVLNHC